MSGRASGGGTPGAADAVALYLRSIEAFNERGTDAWLDTCGEEITIRTVEGFPGGGEYRGRAAVKAFMDSFTEAWELARFESVEERVVNDSVVSRCRWKVRGRESGVDTQLDFFAVADLDGALIESLILLWTEQEALELARAR